MSRTNNRDRAPPTKGLGESHLRRLFHHQRWLNTNGEHGGQLVLARGSLDATFQRVTFDGTDFSRSILGGRAFNGSSLRQVRFVDAILTNVVFDNCDLTGADFRGARLTYASFKNADCSGADFRGASFVHVSFENANCSGALFDEGAPVQTPPAHPALSDSMGL